MKDSYHYCTLSIMDCMWDLWSRSPYSNDDHWSGRIRSPASVAICTICASCSFRSASYVRNYIKQKSKWVKINLDIPSLHREVSFTCTNVYTFTLLNYQHNFRIFLSPSNQEKLLYLFFKLHQRWFIALLFHLKHSHMNAYINLLRFYLHHNNIVVRL